VSGNNASAEGRRLIKAHAQKLNQPQAEASLHVNQLKPHTFGHQVESVSPQAHVAGRPIGPAASTPARFGHDFSRLPVQAKAPVGLQAKLTVNTPGDSYEQEADRVAAQVTGASAPQHACACGGGCSNCQRKQTAQTQLQAKHVGPDGAQEFAAPPVVQDQLHAAGQPLPATTREFMEPRFGHDFSRVRVHTDGLAANAARAVRARAYTIGQDIVFGSGQFAPTTTMGQQLLAHELTHVVQQNSNASTQGALIQRFESDEHQFLGDVATRTDKPTWDNPTLPKGATYNVGAEGGKFELTHGDILALSGDVFEPDELFRLASTKGHYGQKTETRDEVLWALQDERIWEMRKEKKEEDPKGEEKRTRYTGKKDPRFAPNGPFGENSGYIYSEDVKKAVFNRYRKLGAANVGHFVSPEGRADTGIANPSRNSAGRNYRKWHEKALSVAGAAGHANQPTDMPLAREAAAQHYLTDAFSAGHLRTPIALIRDYWSKKYPMFWFNLRHKIALDTALEMTSGTPISAHYGYMQILGAIEKMEKDLPDVTLGDLLASVYHDADNERGVQLVGGGKVVGDTHLNESKETVDRAVAAIKSGNEDVKTAHQIGQTAASALPDDELFKQVRQQRGGDEFLYAPELLIPAPDTGEPSQNWKAPDIQTLWEQPFLGTTKPTVGQEISKRVQGGAIANQLKALGDSFPEKESGLHPRYAYLKGFVYELQLKPKEGLLDIINWAPHGMDTGDSGMETARELERREAAARDVGAESKESIANLNVEQRAKLITQILNQDKGVGSVEHQEMIIKLFETATPQERPAIYEKVEGHPWEGEFHHDAKDRDRLFRVMNASRLAPFKQLINGK
jgi:Domain of unknown function (DUF4157)